VTDLVDVRGHAARTEIADAGGVRFQGSNSSGYGRDERQCVRGRRPARLGVYSIHLGRDDEAMHGRGALSAAVRSAEQS
jgi:hypothetical protein